MAIVTEQTSTKRANAPSPPSGSKVQPDTSQLNWSVLIWIGLLHLGALAAPFTFTWQALAAAFVLHWLTGGVGICLGFHRLFTHSSFTTYRPVRWFLACVGSLAGEGTPAEWVAHHRCHHAKSDQEGDPHSPNDGPWWSHMLWLAYTRQGKDQEEFVQRWAPDLAKDKMIRFIGKMFLPMHLGVAALAFGCGTLLGGWQMGLSMLVWGVFVRLVFVLHCTWFVNSASHMWGYRNYTTTDESRNLWWVAIVTYGEGWHNNHHAYPRMANHGHRWWEFDVTFWTVRAMQCLGLAWNVVDYKQRTLDD